jgi:hypothetical protein
MTWEAYKVDVPEGKSGVWLVERFTVNESGSRLDAMRNAMHGMGGRYVPPGMYTRLVNTGGVFFDTVMSDTPDEVRDHLSAISRAAGVCLINGLGLGMVANAMLMKPDVVRVDVVEISADVISLVAPHWKARHGDRLNVINADAFKWRPPAKFIYDVVWHDIWSGICTDNLEGMARLHRVYARRSKWQGSWSRELCQYQRRRERREEWRYGGFAAACRNS